MAENQATADGDRGRRWEASEEPRERDRRWARRSDEANEATLEALIERQEQMRRRAREHADELADRARSSARWIQALAVVTFAAGLGLLGLAASLAVNDGPSPLSVLGTAGAGTASLLGVLFYRPMDRIDEATSDLAQQETLLRTWAMGVDLELMAADTFDRNSVRKAAGRLRRSARELSRSLQTYVEESPEAPEARDAASSSVTVTNGDASSGERG